MANKIKTVTIRVHPKFYEGWFEPKRKEAERKLGRPISQSKFSGMIADKWKLKRRKTFVPKEFSHMKFYT